MTNQELDQLKKIFNRVHGIAENNTYNYPEIDSSYSDMELQNIKDVDKWANLFANYYVMLISDICDNYITKIDNVKKIFRGSNSLRKKLIQIKKDVCSDNEIFLTVYQYLEDLDYIVGDIDESIFVDNANKKREWKYRFLDWIIGFVLGMAGGTVLYKFGFA